MTICAKKCDVIKANRAYLVLFKISLFFTEWLFLLDTVTYKMCLKSDRIESTNLLF